MTVKAWGKTMEETESKRQSAQTKQQPVRSNTEQLQPNLLTMNAPSAFSSFPSAH